MSSPLQFYCDYTTGKVFQIYLDQSGTTCYTLIGTHVPMNQGYEDNYYSAPMQEVTFQSNAHNVVYEKKENQVNNCALHDIPLPKTQSIVSEGQKNFVSEVQNSVVPEEKLETQVQSNVEKPNKANVVVHDLPSNKVNIFIIKI